MISNELKMVVTDLDGTLLNPLHQISDQDYRSLILLGEKHIYRVVATGRSFYSATNVLPHDFPIDYLIFSSGAGIINYTTREILYSQSLNPDEVVIIANCLITFQIDFMIHKPIPETHKFSFYQTNRENPDFDRRMTIYRKFAKPLTFNPKDFGNATQILAIVPNNVSIYEKINDKLPDFKVIRTTSPLDGNSIWIEIFPKKVSKGSAATWLCEKLDCDPGSVLGIGNDYNDIDLLNWTQHSFVMANAPEDLKNQFEITDSNINSGFTKALSKKFRNLMRESK